MNMINEFMDLKFEFINQLPYRASDDATEYSGPK